MPTPVILRRETKLSSQEVSRSATTYMLVHCGLYHLLYSDSSPHWQCHYFALGRKIEQWLSKLRFQRKVSTTLCSCLISKGSFKKKWNFRHAERPTTIFYIVDIYFVWARCKLDACLLHACCMLDACLMLACFVLWIWICVIHRSPWLALVIWTLNKSIHFFIFF